MTRTSSILSTLQSVFVHARVTHVCFLVKTPNELFMFEGATMRGTQLRLLEDYVSDNKCRKLFFRQTYLDQEVIKEKLIKYSDKPYDWTFLKFIFYHMTNLYIVYLFLTSYEKICTFLQKILFLYRRQGYSCSSVVANVLYEMNAIQPSIDLNAVFPSHFLHFYDDIIKPSHMSQTLQIVI
jgi:hypothetical protein